MQRGTTHTNKTHERQTQPGVGRAVCSGTGQTHAHHAKSTSATEVTQQQQAHHCHCEATHLMHDPMCTATSMCLCVCCRVCVTVGRLRRVDCTCGHRIEMRSVQRSHATPANDTCTLLCSTLHTCAISRIYVCRSRFAHLGCCRALDSACLSCATSSSPHTAVATRATTCACRQERRSVSHTATAHDACDMVGIWHVKLCYV